MGHKLFRSKNAAQVIGNKRFIQIFALENDEWEKVHQISRTLLQPKPFPLPQNTQTTHSPCIQSSEGCRPRAATREHPITYTQSHKHTLKSWTVVLGENTRHSEYRDKMVKN